MESSNNKLDLLAFEALAQVRQKLLDLSRRNPLLNYRETKKTIKIIDEQPSVTYEYLVNDSKTMTFLPIEDDIENEENSNNEDPEIIEDELPSPSIELPSRHTDLYLQTPYIEPSLESRCRSIRQNARTAIEETGTNLLYLAMFFLEWYESNDSSIINRAPLILIPVVLERQVKVKKSGEKLVRYTIKYTEEDIEPNLSLVEKMEREFNLIMPDFDENSDPENYYQKINNLVSGKKRWRVARKMVVGFCSFAKLRMYKDLDPEKWSNTHSIVKHPLVRSVLIGREDTAGGQSGGLEYGEQNGEASGINEDISVILDADSSQLSAIESVRLGKDLVIEGPPGTGKSQTITNMITTAMHEGKSVLFVAEKKAALEVVKKRLATVGLDEFALELHSHKTQRANLIESIKKRINKNYKDSPSLDEKLEDLKASREKLNEYVSLVNSLAGNTGKTIYEIFWALEKASQRVGGGINDINKFSDALLLNRQEIQARIEQIQEISLLQKELTDEQIRNWKWFRPHNYFRGDETTVERALLSTIERLNDYTLWLNKQKDENRIPLKQSLSFLKSLGTDNLDALSNIPHNYECELATIVCKPKAGSLIESLSVSLQEYFKQKEIVVGVFGDWVALESDVLKEIISLGKNLFVLNIWTEKVSNLNLIVEKIESTLVNIEKVQDTCNKLTEIIDTRNFQTINDTEQFNDCYEHFVNIPGDLTQLAVRGMCDIDAKEYFGKIKFYSSELKQLLADEGNYFVLSSIPNSKSLKEDVSILKEHDGKLFRYFSKSYRATVKKIREYLFRETDIKDENLIVRISLLAELIYEIENFKEESKSIEKFGDIYDGVRTDWDKLERFLDWCECLCVLISSRNIATALIADLNLNQNNIIEYCRDIKTLINSANSFLEGTSITLKKDKTFNHLFDEIGGIKKEIISFKNLIDNIPISGISIENIVKGAEGQICAKELEDKLDFRQKYSSFFTQYYEGVNTDTERLKKNFEWVNCISEICHKDNDLIEWVLKEDVVSSCFILKEVIGRQKQFNETINEFLESLKRFGSVDDKCLYRDCNIESLDDLINRLKFCNSEIASLVNWADLIRAYSEGEKIGLGGFIDLMFSGDILVDNARNIFEFCLFSSMANNIVRSNPILSNFTGIKHNKILEKFIELDKEIIRANRNRQAYRISRRIPPVGNSFGKVSSFSELGLLKHLTKLKRINYSIRKIMDKSGCALKALKPCFMMSPISVSQYLAPENIEFDLVIMDEASQIRPVDALGAILRAKQIVVVGDSKQLPPTSFFDKLLLGEDEDEEELTAIADTESILEIASESFDTKILRWHYRSEHENLIKFSNEKFYDNQLIVCSSPYVNGDDYGVKSHYIQGAKYKKGLNKIEGQAVVKKIIEHFQKYPDLSLGVATFNKEQSNYIEEVLDKCCRENSHLDSLHKNSLDLEESFFIKNLENVQGDERDVVFISCVYGPDTDTNKVFQRFGPIAGDTGWRRLNVIFTRAKKRIEIFTSLRPSDIREGSSRGVNCLREYLEFAETGIIREIGTDTGLEPDSDFEISVLNILKEYGIKAKPQIGVSGFRIDIGVLHPHIDNQYILGIECDGATYHSSKVARDRDRLREEILIKKGWQIHRIWSTDWFKNRDKEIDRLLKRIKDITQIIEMTPPETISSEAILSHEIKIFQNDDIESMDVHDDKELRTKLIKFKSDVLDQDCHELSDDGILREEVLDFFVLNKPETMEDFHKKIPLRLREDINPNHLIYLNQIFDVIKNHLSN